MDEKLAKLLEGDEIMDRHATCVGCGYGPDSQFVMLYPSAISKKARKRIEAAAREAGCDAEAATKLWLLAQGPHCGECFLLIEPFLPEPSPASRVRARSQVKTLLLKAGRPASYD